MKIVHICLCGPVTDGFTYQDNLLPKFHRRAGNQVSIITSKHVFSDKGQVVFTNKESYYNRDGVHVIRLNSFFPQKTSMKFNLWKGLYRALEEVSPDLIFVHGVQFLQIPTVVKFIRKQGRVTVFVDNHADHSNSGLNFLSFRVLHGLLWKHMAALIQPYTKKFWGVLPARVDWLTDVYGLPTEQCELLVMGADDDQIDRIESKVDRDAIRRSMNVASDDILIVSGGKIDLAKRQTISLAKAVRTINNPGLKLRIFGSVVPELKAQLTELCDGQMVDYLGWTDVDGSYDDFFAADMAVFPGRHSVYWEQVAGMGIPMICKYWEGTTDVDLGGNVIFLRSDSFEEILNAIQQIVSRPEQLNDMKEVAASEKKDEFLYSNIAKKSIMQGL